MDEELLINVNGFETRVALLQNHSLVEVHLQRSGTYSLTGNIYKGRVERILPGMQAAFVSIGLSRPGFLHARDIQDADANGAGLALVDGAASTVGAQAPEPKARDIRHLLHDGDSLLVQIAKDPLATKGARLTTHLALPSRYLVLMPLNRHIGISQRIDDPAERERLRACVEDLRSRIEGAGSVGFIVRTAADGATPADLEADMTLLVRMWAQVADTARSSPSGSLVFEELPPHTRVIRDLAGDRLKVIKIDEAHTFQKVRQFVARFMPTFDDRVMLYDEPHALFARHGVEDEIARALHSNVGLRCGGYIVVEQTEAMTTIDVNTGGFVGAKSLEDTVFRTNLEAAAVIPRQLRLRNLGGIIVIDFIDMEDEEHRRQVMRTLERAFESDPARVRISGFSALGLVEMSRKRTRESLARLMCEPCATCRGRATVKTAETVCFEVFRAILDDARRRATDDANRGDYVVRASQNVVDRLLDEESHNVQCLAEQVRRTIRFQVEPSYGPEHFDVVLAQGLAR